MWDWIVGLFTKDERRYTVLLTFGISHNIFIVLHVVGERKAKREMRRWVANHPFGSALLYDGDWVAIDGKMVRWNGGCGAISAM